MLRSTPWRLTSTDAREKSSPSSAASGRWRQHRSILMGCDFPLRLGRESEELPASAQSILSTAVSAPNPTRELLRRNGQVGHLSRLDNYSQNSSTEDAAAFGASRRTRSLWSHYSLEGSLRSGSNNAMRFFVGTARSTAAVHSKRAALCEL